MSSDGQPQQPVAKAIDPADRDCLERFLKINARHITDGHGVVAGILLITPNALMFDPNVSDPLVIERGAEEYGVTVPMELTIKAAMYSDIAHMRVKHLGQEGGGGGAGQSSSTPRPEVYCGMADSIGDEQLLKDAGFDQQRYQQVVQKKVSTGSGSGDVRLASLEEENRSVEDDGRDEPDGESIGAPEIKYSQAEDDSQMEVDGQRQSEEEGERKKGDGQEEDEAKASGESQRSGGKETNQRSKEQNQSLVPESVSGSKSAAPDEATATVDGSESQSSHNKRTAPVDSASSAAAAAAQRQNQVQDSTADGRQSKPAPGPGPATATGPRPGSAPEQGNHHSQDESIPQDKDIPQPQQDISKPEMFVSQDSAEEAACQSPTGWSQSNDPKPGTCQKVTLGLRYSVPEGAANRSPPSPKPKIHTTNSAEDAATIEKRRSATGESRREQMLKRLSNPVESISNYTKSGISAGVSATKSGISATKSGITSGITSGINVTKSGFNKIIKTPKNLVEFSSGLVRDAKGALSSSSSSKADSLEALEDYGGGQTPPNQHQMVDRQTSIGYKNMADVEMTDPFANFEKLIRTMGTRTTRNYEDPPLYLCLRMGRATNKRLQKYSPAIISFGKKKIQREYWFSVPKEKANSLYHFFLRWAPEIYGDVDDLTGCEERGLRPIDTDDEENEGEDEVFEGDGANRSRAGSGESDKSGQEKQPKQKFWRRRGPLNFLKLVEGRFAPEEEGADWAGPADGSRHFFHLDQPGVELPLPELVGPSEVLGEEHRKKLSKHLPARAEGYAWTLIYSSSKHGFSLKTLYREMVRFETPILLVIQDTFGTVFGALTSCALRLSDHFYGTGETFLYTFHPEFQCFPWTGENLYFIKGNVDSIAIGAGDGHFGLWLDGDLYHGRTHPCKTFGNIQLSVQEDFVVKSLECWGFV